MTENDLAEQKPPEPKLRLNIACGQRITPMGYPEDGTWTGIDKVETEVHPTVHDLDIIPWPFKENSVDEVYCAHYVEHVKDLPVFMDEMWRIMKQGSKATIIAPYYSSQRCWQDPYHVRAISEASFLYYNKEWRKVNKLDHYPIKCDFDFSYGYILAPDWAQRSQEARDFAIKSYLNVVNDIQVTLTKK